MGQKMPSVLSNPLLYSNKLPFSFFNLLENTVCPLGLTVIPICSEATKPKHTTSFVVSLAGKRKGTQSCACRGPLKEWREAVTRGCAHNNVYLKCSPWMLRGCTTMTTDIRPFSRLFTKLFMSWEAVREEMQWDAHCLEGTAGLVRGMEETGSCTAQWGGSPKLNECLTAPTSLLLSVVLFINRDSNKQVDPAQCHKASKLGLEVSQQRL